MRNLFFKAIALILVGWCVSGCGSTTRYHDAYLLQESERWSGGTSSE